MATVADRILEALAASPDGLDDGKLTAAVDGRRSTVSQAARRLAEQGRLVRKISPAGLIVNVLVRTDEASAGVDGSTTTPSTGPLETATVVEPEDVADAEPESAPAVVPEPVVVVETVVDVEPESVPVVVSERVVAVEVIETTPEPTDADDQPPTPEVTGSAEPAESAVAPAELAELAEPAEPAVAPAELAELAEPADSAVAPVESAVAPAEPTTPA
ncbi:MAG: hypothetical protein ACQSGP_16960, partial [Frankia sp.]